MGFFQSIQKPGFKAAQAKNSHIQQEVIRTTTDPRNTQSPIPFAQRLNNRLLHKKQASKQDATKDTPSPKPRIQNPRKRAASTPQRFDSDSDDVDISDRDLNISSKRLRRSSDPEADPTRQIRSGKAFSEEVGGHFPMVHAADIATLSKHTAYRAAFPDDPQAIEIHLQYPSASQREK